MAEAFLIQSFPPISGLQIKQKFSGMLENFATTTQTITYTFSSPVIPDNCIVLISQGYDSYNGIIAMTTGYTLTTSSLSVSMSRGLSSKSSKLVFEVIELVSDSFKSLQKGYFSYGFSSSSYGPLLLNMPINSVNINKSIIISRGDLSATTDGANFSITPFFVSDIQLRCVAYISNSGSTGNRLYFTWNVLELN